MLPAEVKTTSLQRVTGVGGGQAPRTPGRLSGGRTQITPLGAVLPRHARPRLSVQIGGDVRAGRWSALVTDRDQPLTWLVTGWRARGALLAAVRRVAEVAGDWAGGR